LFFFGSLIFRKLRLKYEEMQKEKVPNRYFLEVFLQFDVHIVWLFICDMSFQKWY